MFASLVSAQSIECTSAAAIQNSLLQNQEQAVIDCGSAAIPTITDLLTNSQDAYVRRQAATTLGRIASDGINPALANLSEEEREISRAVIAGFSGQEVNFLGDLDTPSNTDLPNLELAITALYQAFEADLDQNVMLAAARSLVSIGVSNADFVSALIDRGEQGIVNEATTGTDSFTYGGNHGQFLDSLWNLLRKTRDPAVLGRDADAINTTLMRLVALVEQGECYAALPLEEALAIAETPSLVVINAFVDVLREGRCPGQAPITALGDIQMTPETESIIIPFLITTAEQGDFLAVFALGSLGSQAEAAIPALLQIAQTSEEWEIRSGAIHAIGRIGTPNAEAISFLTTNLERDEMEDTHPVSALSLGLIGAPAESALPTLVQRLETLAMAGNTELDYFAHHTVNAAVQSIVSIISASMAENTNLSTEEVEEWQDYLERSLAAVAALPSDYADLQEPLREALETMDALL